MVNLVVYTENYFHGGLEKFIFDLLESKDINVHIIVNYQNNRIIEFARNNKISYTTVDLVNYKINAETTPLIYKKIIKIINFFLHNIYMIPNYFKVKNILKNLNSYRNILIVNGGYPAAVSCFSTALAAKNSQFKNIGLSVLSSPSPNYKNKIFKFFQLKLDLFFDKSINLYLPNSNNIKEKLISTVGLNQNKIKTVYTGIKMPSKIITSDILKYNTSILKKQQGEIWIGMLGLLGSTKRQDLIIDVLEKLDKHVKLLLVGDGPKMKFLMDKVVSLELEDRVIFTGWMSDVHNVYSFLDMVVFVSDQEGLPYAVSEAMSYKVPVVASNVGGISEQIIHGVGGLLIENNKEDIIENVNRLIGNRELQNNYVNYSFNRVRDLFSTVSMNNQIVGLYK